MDDLRTKVAQIVARTLELVESTSRSFDGLTEEATTDILNLIGGDGWKLVPVEPTREMLKAAGDYADQCAIHNYGGSPDHEGVWGAMIAASPPPKDTP